MKPSRIGELSSRIMLAPTTLVAAAIHADAALASQGPGGGPGTAGHVTQTAMAIVVYGTAALLIAAGLIGMGRRRRALRALRKG